MQPLIDHARLAPQRQSGRRIGGAPAPAPRAMFIACSDARLVPTELTGARPGELFELRTAGNVIPPHRIGRLTAEAATVEYAVNVLRITDMILCGHSQCGAVQARTRSQAPRTAPTMWLWLLQTHHWRRLHTPGADPGADPGHQHLLAQADKLRRYPAVTRSLRARRLRMHLWYYDVNTAAVSAHQENGVFAPL
ncbi:carbonic anhydrase [Actinomadura citrea]|uniref:Carbonic anhydrase n=1 Tax=Actinomadura citrea TaxID=46158 RepID=A0A7Y9G847_9ACTN|nr:carbonic anhydrase [Actinomadura citrea]NYE11727.1 carbonic anhydrase [Actinomadura citrea]GGU11632.1 carbonic anhydrase [Actinomadura citrea]